MEITKKRPPEEKTQQQNALAIDKSTGKMCTSIAYELIYRSMPYTDNDRVNTEKSVKLERTFELSLQQEYLRVIWYQYCENNTLAKQSEEVYEKVTDADFRKIQSSCYPWKQITGFAVENNGYKYVVFEAHVQKNNSHFDYYGIKKDGHDDRVQKMIYARVKKR